MEQQNYYEYIDNIDNLQPDELILPRLGNLWLYEKLKERVVCRNIAVELGLYPVIVSKVNPLQWKEILIRNKRQRGIRNKIERCMELAYKNLRNIDFSDSLKKLKKINGRVYYWCDMFSAYRNFNASIFLYPELRTKYIVPLVGKDMLVFFDYTNRIYFANTYAGAEPVLFFVQQACISEYVKRNLPIPFRYIYRIVHDANVIRTYPLLSVL